MLALLALASFAENRPDVFINDPNRNKSILSEHESSKAKVPRLSGKYGPLA